MKAPHFWSHGLDPRSREAAPVTRALLTPFEAAYVWGIRRKLRRAQPAAPPVPVICVGNVTVGGVGKTPVVAALRDRLTRLGYRAASLSRGYGGRQAGPLQVDPVRHCAREVGDEPLMLSHTGESWIGRDRRAAALAMAEAGVEVIIMDDGFQNPSLGKTLSLLAVDAAAPFGNGFCLPKGPLREPVADAMARADALLAIGSTGLPAGWVPAGLPVIRVSIEPLAPPPTGPLVAFAGIGRPQKLFDSLTATGADLREAVGYGDHYVYTRSDLAFLRQLARDHGASLITTEKDHVRLPADERRDILAWPVRAVFDESAIDIDSWLKSSLDTL